MKTLRLVALTISFFSLFATSIEFGNHSIFYGIGQKAFSGYWAISESGNNFSSVHIDTFMTDTQLWLLHDALFVKHDEGDSLIDYAYHCRYFIKDSLPGAWQAFDPIIGTSHQDETGYWYTSGYLDDVALFDLPLDTGTYYLEFEHIATVVGKTGDTLIQTYVLPDSVEFKAEFTVVSSEKDGTEGSTSIELASLCAECAHDNIELTWVTESETENSHFLIYRNGEMIGCIDGNGTTTEQHRYTYLDTGVQSGMYEYILADVSYGGAETQQASVNIKVESNEIEADFVLNKAYPNPFNPRTAINYQLSAVSNIDLSIYNTAGEKVATLFSGKQSAGQHQLLWNAAKHPSGIYLLKMQVGENAADAEIGINEIIGS